MKSIAVALIIFTSASALAYRDGLYRCKSSDDSIPPNEYKIETVNVGGHQLPYLEITRHYKSKSEDGRVSSHNTFVKGLAQISVIGDREILNLGALKLEFKGDTLQNCRQ